MPLPVKWRNFAVMTSMTHDSGTIPEWTLGDRLRKARSLTGLTTREFADQIGVSQKTVTNAEGDKVEVRKIVLNAWSLRTGVPVEWLQTGTIPAQRGGPDDDGTYLPVNAVLATVVPLHAAA